MDRIIISELHKTLTLLGADRTLLGTVNSWKKSLPDDMVLSGLRHWNEIAAEKIQQRLDTYQARPDQG
ncbi:hypothetical protein H206_00434 [Candidatus Electrothrix aarhusensis]|uniref:Uncharacterized protein n=1 Tax=Candidatus Electrothrix aarhusensis TaxID=1859131 RepID=A0A3S3SMS0_9BACT|nr:hypothetical protein H206_00434 [Candidatus Electrothrix aarhusensis]